MDGPSRRGGDADRREENERASHFLELLLPELLALQHFHNGVLGDVVNAIRRGGKAKVIAAALRGFAEAVERAGDRARVEGNTGTSPRVDAELLERLVGVEWPQEPADALEAAALEHDDSTAARRRIVAARGDSPKGGLSALATRKNRRRRRHSRV